MGFLGFVGQQIQTGFGRRSLSGRLAGLAKADCDDRDDRQGHRSVQILPTGGADHILVSIPSITGEEGASHCLDWVVPAGTVKVGTTVRVAFIEMMVN